MMETYRGHVRSPADAIKLFEACRLGILPRVQRRLSEKERQSIQSGSVFVWDEREAGMRRWTDGKSWSASRVSGSFLTYREMEGKRGGGNFVPAPRRLGGKTPDSGRGSDEDADMDGDGPDGYRYKPDGLMKQSFSISTTTGQNLHLISYYARPHSSTSDLPQPTTDPALRHIVPMKGMYPESTVHDQAPPPTRAPAQTPYLSSPQQMLPGPPPQGLPLAPYPYQQGYPPWPPSPVSTPPYNYPQSMYNALPPPPPNGHASPHQYPPQHLPPHLQQSPQQGYDRPPQLSHASGPHDPLQRHSGPPSQMSPLAYATNAARSAEQALAQPAQRMAPMGQGPGMLDPRLAPPVQYHHQQQQYQYQQHHQQQPQQQQHQQQTNGHALQPVSPATKDQSTQQNQPSPRLNGVNNPALRREQQPSQSIPSISNMVHGSPSSAPPRQPTPSQNHTSSTTQQPLPSPSAQNAAQAPSQQAADAPAQNGRASPTAAVAGQDAQTEEGAAGGRPQDIPHAKLVGTGGFAGEDMRALRVLDRKFCI